MKTPFCPTLTEALRLRTGPLLPLLALCAVLPAAGAAAEAPVKLVGRELPQIEQLPAGPYKTLVQYGHELATRTTGHIGPEAKDPAKHWAGNNLSCSSCHQAGATKPYAMPWVGVTATFPQYRGREDAISTVEERVNGCMERSMNGKPIPLDALEMKAFVAYMAFLSRGVPVGAAVEGAGMVLSKMPNRRADPAAGQPVYEAKCAACHGSDGQGRRVGQAGDGQGYLFPPLWGPDSFNTGAGMNRLAMATRFVKHNMPMGAQHDATQLSDDEAYDAAAYMLSHARPEKAHLERDFPARWNKPVDAPFPPYMLGASPDQHRWGPFPPLAEKQRQLAEQRRQAAAAAAAPVSPATPR